MRVIESSAANDPEAIIGRSGVPRFDLVAPGLTRCTADKKAIIHARLIIRGGGIGPRRSLLAGRRLSRISPEPL